MLFSALAAAPVSAATEEEGAKAQAIYLPLDSFVVNLRDTGRRVRFMQVSVQVMTHEPEVIEAIKGNMPPVRDAMIMLLAHQTTETMGHVEGRERIRQEAQTAIQQVLADVAGLQKGVEAVYFTDFVVQ